MKSCGFSFALPERLCYCGHCYPHSWLASIAPLISAKPILKSVSHDRTRRTIPGEGGWTMRTKMLVAIVAAAFVALSGTAVWGQSGVTTKKVGGGGASIPREITAVHVE